MKIRILIGFATITSTCLFFALITNHKWEDWYITFRASKNFAQGNGLVFNVGEKLMTYTSPLGTIIPSFIKYLFFSQPDEFSIWIYRIICSIILGSICFFLSNIIKKLLLSTWSYYLLVGFISLNFLIIDNTINGMESAFMVFFISYYLYLIICHPSRLIVQLSICFAGIMYSRPDGFIYLTAITLGFILFKPNQLFIFSKDNFSVFIKSIIFGILLFSPWILTTWIYYGTPIPHTIIAKSRNISLWEYLISTVKFILKYKGTPMLFLPSYSSNFGGWGGYKYFAAFLSLPTVLYWMLPNLNKTAKAISFASGIMIIYLYVVSGQGPSPWYLPSVILPVLITLTIVIDGIQKWLQSKFSLKFISYLPSFIIIFIMLNILNDGTQMIKYQQKIIEDDGRKNIGLWLGNHKKHNEKAFMECLGYIGFYSNIKTYDFPGMSSPEVVNARKKLNNTTEYGEIINYLKPEWLILRPLEVDKIYKNRPMLLEKQYKLVKVFDQSSAIKKARIRHGEAYLQFDAIFNVYYKK